MKKTIIFVSIALLTALALAAQDDRSAGLFTEAGQLPLVSQSVVVRIHGGEARVELAQVFANDGPEIAQADYRLHLPREATVTAFGFWHDGEFLAAELKERGEARRSHAAAASSGRATGILQREGAIHSFSVFPVPAGGLQEIAVTIAVPVATERGRSHVRLPLDAFLGHARLTSTVIAIVETSEPLRDFGVDGARIDRRSKKHRSAELIFSTEQPVEIWWAAEAPPLLARAEEVVLDDGSTAVQLRLALNETGRRSAGPSEVALLVDASFSMKRRRRAIEELVGRVLDQATVPVRIIAVAEEAIEITDRDSREAIRHLLSGEAGFATRWEDLEDAAARLGCGYSDLRCVVVTDPQVRGLPVDRELETLFLADADELAHFPDHIVRPTPVYQPDVEPIAALHALADELVLPVLELRSVRQGSDELEPVGSPRQQVAAGGLLRLYYESRSSEPLRIELAIDGRGLVRTVPADSLDPSSRIGRAVRRGFFQGRLDDWMADYRLHRDPELRQQIVDVSLREEIPTKLTALHVASPDRVMSRTATPAPLLRKAGLLLLVLGGVLLAIGRWRTW